MKKTMNYITLEFLSRSSNEGFARTAVACFAAQMDPTLGELEDIKTAVSEAVTNAIVHGYRENGGKVKMTCILQNDEMTVIIEDSGVGIADVEKARQPFYTTGPREERSGMGFAVMEAFMDSLTVESAPGKGTRVTMKKRAFGADVADDD